MRENKEVSDLFNNYTDFSHIIAETESDGHAIRDIVWQGIEPVAQIDIEGASETITYLHTDHLATPRSGTDENGHEVWSWNSDPIGLDGGLNTYLYANANPVRFVDPTGEIGVAGAVIIVGGVCLGMYTLITGTDSCADKYPNHKIIGHPDRR